MFNGTVYKTSRPGNSKLHIHTFMHPFYSVLGIPGDTLGISGDQVGMNGDEGGRGWGVRRFGEWFIENKGLGWKNMQNGSRKPNSIHKRVSLKASFAERWNTDQLQ